MNWFQHLAGGNERCFAETLYQYNDGFGGLVVSMLASGSRVRGFDPDRSCWIFFRCEKILSVPSFGGEVK
jgi:hypothetical protein